MSETYRINNFLDQNSSLINRYRGDLQVAYCHQGQWVIHSGDLEKTLIIVVICLNLGRTPWIKRPADHREAIRNVDDLDRFIRKLDSELRP